LVINKSSSNVFVALGVNTSVTNQVNMQTGYIELNGFDLNLGTTGSLVNETSANRVTGTTGGRILATRTLNAPSSINVAGLGAVLSSSVNMGSTEVIRKHNQVIFGVGFGGNRRYEIHPTTNTGLNATLVFNYFDDELVTASGTIVEGEFDLWRFNGTIWTQQTGTINMVANTITKTGIPEFSEWTGGSYVNNPLAIELAYFKLNCNEKSTDFIWKTLKETDSKTFFIEASSNGRNWEMIGSTKAAGNSGEERDYKLTIAKIPSGFNQARLTLSDEMGEKHIFNTLSLNCNGDIKPFNPSVYPNPGNGDFTLDVSGIDEIVEISIINTLGQQVAGQFNDGTRNQKIKVDLRGYASGIYRMLLSVKDLDGEIQQKSLNLIVR